MSKITPDDVLRMVESIPGRDGQIVRLYYGLDGERYPSKEISRILGIKNNHTVRGVILDVERRLKLAATDETISIADYVQAGLMRRRAGLTTGTTGTTGGDRT